MEKNKTKQQTKKNIKIWLVYQTDKNNLSLWKKKIAENLFSKKWRTDTELLIEQAKDTFLYLKGHHLVIIYWLIK